MYDLASGIHRFQNHVFKPQKEFYERLVDGQQPRALFVGCADSRVVPNLITQTNPGDLFVLRNAGNIVPPHGASNGGEAATIEFAVAGLTVDHIIICGHTGCGAIKALLNPEATRKMPLVAAWLSHAEATRRILEENYGDYSGESLESIAVQEHVLVQIENIQTHPSVAARLQRGDLAIHGWVYKLSTGEVFEYSREEGRFLPLVEKSEPVLSVDQNSPARPQLHQPPTEGQLTDGQLTD